MFKVTLSQLILIYIALPLLLLFVLWFLKEKRNSKHLNIEDEPNEFVMECPMCQHVFINTKKEDVVECPMCKNYFKKLSL